MAVPYVAPGPDAADLIEDLGAIIAARYAAAEERMIERVARLTAAAADSAPSVVERSLVLAQLRQEGQRIARDLTDPAYVQRLVSIAAEQGRTAALAELERIDIPRTTGISRASARATAAIALDLTNRLDSMRNRITRWMPDTYQRTVSLVTPNVVLGVDTLREAQRRAAEQFIAQGVTGHVDRAGRHWRIGTYAEMATRTSVNRAQQEAGISTQQDAGLNLVSIIIGANACGRCAQHAGKVWSTDGTPGGVYTLEHATEDRLTQVTVAGTLEQARQDGWNHPNCRCAVVAYLPGLSIPRGSTYNPGQEKARDRLRALERRTRYYKRREAAAFDDITRARMRRKVRETQADIRDHVNKTGLNRKNYREQLRFSDGPPPALPATGPRALTP